MAYYLTDGTSTVSFAPEYDLKQSAKKIEHTHRTRSGANYRYVWGSYKHVSCGIQYISSADMCRINSWWGANIALVLLDANSAAVVSGYLVNGSAPIDAIAKPYTDQYMGTIELESY